MLNLARDSHERASSVIRRLLLIITPFIGAICLSLLILFVTFVSGDEPTFGEPRPFGTGSDKSYSVAVGDLDNDGDLDLVVGGRQEQNVVYLNDGAGHFDWAGATRDFGSGADDTMSVALGDVDDDGDLDIVVGNLREQNAVYLNDGAGHFDWPGSTRTVGSGVDASYSIAVGDVDGDGDVDLAIANGEWFSDTQNTVYLNDGVGNYDWTGAVRHFGTGSEDSRTVALGDVNGDGYLDLAVGNHITQNVVYLNDGAGNYAWSGSARNYGTGSDDTRGVTLGDLDGDGDLDLVAGTSSPVAPGPGDQNVVYLNDGAGNFEWPGAAVNYGTGIDWTRSVAVADVDGDGALDLVVGNYDPGGSSQNVVYLNNGAADFSLARSFGPGSDRTQSIAVADVDGNGTLDIVSINDQQPNAIYLNDGAGDLSDVHTFDHGFITGVALGDMDGDGDLDIVTSSAIGDEIHFNVGTGSFPSGADYGATFPDVVALGDMDGDMDIDIVTGDYFGQNIVYLNDGTSGFYTDTVNCASPPADAQCFGPISDTPCSVGRYGQRR